MPDPRRQIIGRRSKESGETFERWLSNACEFYLRNGWAHIEKTPEPFHITGKDRINQNVVTDTQWKSLDIYEQFGAHCYVMVSLGLVRFYRVPWKIWKQMKELFGHKFMTEQELEPYRLPERQCTILILEGVGLKDENTENRAGAEAE